MRYIRLLCSKLAKICTFPPSTKSRKKVCHGSIKKVTLTASLLKAVLVKPAHVLLPRKAVFFSKKTNMEINQRLGAC